MFGKKKEAEAPRATARTEDPAIKPAAKVETPAVLRPQPARAASELPRKTPDLLERLSYVFGIYKDLQVLLPDPAAADAWIRKPNSAPLFNGRSALDRLLSGHVADLYVVRQYLDAERGGWS